jgi:hypothetical protein
MRPVAYTECVISQEELVTDVRWPDIVFKNEYTITLGGQHARVINSLEAIAALDFDSQVQPHSPTLNSKADVVASIQWCKDLRTQVSAGIKAGRTLDELKKTLAFDAYKEWCGYNELPNVIESAYNNLTRVDNRVTR